MNILPSAPTDNLYKFTALTGLWLIVLSFVYTLSFLYLDNEESEQKYSQSVVKHYKESNEFIDFLIKAYEGNYLSEVVTSEEFINSIAKFLLHKNGEIKNVDALKQDKKTNLITIEKHKEIINDRVVNKHIYSFVINQWLIVFGFFLIGLVLTYLGFFFWYHQVQRPLDKRNSVDYEIKVLSREKLKKKISLIDLEIKQSKKNRHPWQK